MSSESDEIIATFFEEFDDIDVFGTAATGYELVFLAFECDSRLAEGFGEPSGDESDDPMLDIG